MKKNKYHQKLKAKVIGNTKKNIFSVLILVTFFAIGMYGYRCFFQKVCGSYTLDTLVRHSVKITTPLGLIVAEVADTESSRELGLSGRQSLNPNEGLLFVFDLSGQYRWWVKDMKFSVDIIWINKDGIVVEIERNASPDSYPKTYINASPAKYVLELQAGEGEKQGIFLGSKVKINN